MKLNTLLVISAIVAAVFGLALVLAPGPLLSLYGVTLDRSGNVVTQLWGAALLGFAVLDWLGRNLADSQARRIIVLSNLVPDAVGFIVILIGQLAGAANALGWVSVALYFLLALGFGYIQFMKPETA